jgi:hypothetical protein
MLQQLPAGSTQQSILTFLHRLGLGGAVDFLYAPTNFRKDALFGYCFLNFVDHSWAARAMRALQQAEWPGQGASVVQVAWSETFQGLAAQIERYRNCPVMHPVVPSSYKPMLLAAGQPVAFPAPTTAVSAPRGIKKAKFQ